jgi:DNA-binding LacI/PurR family transcriptional regulator
LRAYVGLTTVAQPLEEWGERGARLLLDALEGWPGAPEELRCELVVRDTSAAPRQSRVQTAPVVA